jgi:hypothetical protein
MPLCEKKRILYFFLLSITLLLLSCGAETSGNNPPAIRDGVLNLEGWDFERDGPVHLEGK